MLKEHCHADSCLERKSPPIDITRKYDKLWIVAFNQKFHYDDSARAIGLPWAFREHDVFSTDFYILDHANFFET